MLVRNPDGSRRELTTLTASHPSTWGANQTKAFLHDVVHAIAAHGFDRVSFDPGCAC